MDLETLLEYSKTTRLIRSGRDLLGRVPEILAEARATDPGDSGPILIADEKTWEAAGLAVDAAFRKAGRPPSRVKLFPGSPPLKAEYRHVEALVAELRNESGFVLAVGSGTLNDLAKLACGEMGRPYGVVGTAASMDGYSSQGAAILKDGLKQTIKCPAPVLVVADSKVLSVAPPEMAASGYADLAAKIPAGLDWILADRLGADPIEPTAWAMVHDGLEESLEDAAGVGRGDAGALARIFGGLTATGCAMQYYGDSRPVAGVEHQFSHVLEMEGWTHRGRLPSHGFKVGIGCLASLVIHRELLGFLESDEALDAGRIEEAAAAYPSHDSERTEARSIFGGSPALEAVEAVLEAKRPSAEELRGRLAFLEKNRRRIAADLREALPDIGMFRDRLAAAGAPSSAAEIGLDPEKTERTIRTARLIRNRYAGLDLACELGILDSVVKIAAREI